MGVVPMPSVNRPSGSDRMDAAGKSGSTVVDALADRDDYLDANKAAASHGHAGIPNPAAAADGHVWTADGAGGAAWEAPAAGGVTDHGALTGLADDDHTQYHNDTRGDARYYTKAQTDSADDAHQAAAEATAAAALTAHHGPTSTDHDDRYYTESEVDTALAGKAATSHGHAAGDVSGLAAVATSGAYADLSGKPTVPAVLDDLSDVSASSPSSGQSLQWNGSAWVPATAGGSFTVRDEGANAVSRSALDVRGLGLQAWDDGTNARLTATGGLIHSTQLSAKPDATLGAPGETYLYQANPFSPLSLWSRPFASWKSAQRAASGTSRTITTAYAHNLTVGCLVDVTKVAAAANYTGRRMPVTAVTSTTVTYTHPNTLSESTTADAGLVVSCLALPDLAPITNRSSSGTTRTLTTPAAHNLGVGDVIAVTGITSDYNIATATVASVPSSTTFTYTHTTTLTEGSTATTGYVEIAWQEGTFQRGNGVNKSLGQAATNQGRAAIPAYTPDSQIALSPGQYVDIGTTMPPSLTLVGTLNYASGGWKASSGSGVHGAFIYGNVEPNYMVCQARVKTLPASGLMLLGFFDGTFGYPCAITSGGVIKFRRLYGAADLPGASGAGAVVAGDVIVVEKVGRMLQAHVFTYATTGNTYKSTIRCNVMGLTAGFDASVAPMNLGIGFEADSTAEWYGGTTTDGSAWIRLGV